MITDYIIITAILALLYSTPFISEIENSISKYTKVKFYIPKPFSCLCCTCFWSTLIYISIKYQFDLNTLLFSSISYYVADIFSRIINKIQELLDYIF